MPLPLLACFEPLLAQDASYFAASARIASLARRSIGSRCYPNECRTFFKDVETNRRGGMQSMRDAELARRMVHVDACAQVELGLIAELLAGEALVGLRPVLREAVRVFEVVRLEVGLEHAVELRDDLVERPAPPGAGVEGAALVRGERFHVRLHDVVDVNEIPLLLAGREDPRALAGAH